MDRSAAYAARYVAKNVVAAGLAASARCRWPTPSAWPRPMNITVYTEGTGVIPDDKSPNWSNAHFDLRPKGIIQMLDLLRPIYENRRLRPLRPRRAEFTWERTDKAAALRAAAGL